MTRILALLLIVAVGGCVHGRHAQSPAPGSAAARLPVLLVVEGTAVDAKVAADVAALLSTRIARPVVTATEPALDEGEQRARLAKSHGRLRPGGWAEASCALGRAAAHALRYDADAHYHVHLDRTDATRDATPQERARVSGARRASAAALRRLGLASAGSVHDVTLSGELTVATFGPVPGTQRVPLRATAREIDPLGAVRIDAAAAVAGALDELPRPPFPHWNVTARRQLAVGCRVTALAIYDARLRSRADSRDIVSLALARPTTKPARAPAPAVPSAPVPPPEAPVLEARYTCRALCEMHMVELCNNDRDLWGRNQLVWESTPCGQRRSEPFLLDCYQRQWLSGTFDEACVRPCEGAPDGRARLLHMLQGGGCTRMTKL